MLLLPYGQGFCCDLSQSGAGRFAFVALLLLALPLELTFHALFALPRLADRRRTFWYSLHPRYKAAYSCGFPSGFSRLISFSRHPLIMFRRSLVCLIQNRTRLLCKWNSGFAVSINMFIRLHFSAA